MALQREDLLCSARHLKFKDATVEVQYLFCGMTRSVSSSAEAGIFDMELKPRMTNVPDMSRLSVASLAEAREELRAIKIGEKSINEIGLSIYIIQSALGEEFRHRELGGVPDDSSDGGPSLRTLSVIAGHCLWTLRLCDGFQDFARRSSTSKLNSVLYELFVARTFQRASRNIAFNVPSGTKGADFDLIAESFECYERINIEVKARRETFRTPKQLKDYLNVCRRQLAPGSSGALAIRVVLDGKSIDQETAVAVARKSIQDSSRLELIFFVWEVSTNTKASAHAGIFVSLSGIVNLGAREPEVIYHNMSYLQDLVKYQAAADA